VPAVLNELAENAVWQDEPMFVSAAPGVLLWPAAMIVWGPGEASSGHAHHCVQLVMALEGSLRIRNEPNQQWVEGLAALIKPDVRHEVDARGSLALIAFVDAESALGGALRDRAITDITLLTAEVSGWRTRLCAPNGLTAEAVEAWVRDELLKSRHPPVIHPGVHRVLGYLRDQIGSTETFTLRGLAEIAGLSASRFMHVFTASVGVPMRPYILWLRLQRACGELMKGANATEAAHSAGFSDAAHMTRTFRRMLGTTPAEVVARRGRSSGALIETD
jgi:AraC-like DNA-binding protein